MVEAEGLTKVFEDRKRGKVVAVEDLSFRCMPGEVYGLLGPNGAGKTTTLRMLATILRPTSGSARVAGHDVLREPGEVRRRIGFLSSETGLYPRLTPRETIRYFGRLQKVDPEELAVRVDQLIESLGIGEFADSYNDRLSTGMKQRVSIARAIVHDPPVMIFDEPAKGLDPVAAESVLSFVRKCKAEGKAVIFSTHVMSEAEKLCDRIGILYGGKLLAEGTLDELKTMTSSGSLEEAFLSMVGAAHGSR